MSRTITTEVLAFIAPWGRFDPSNPSTATNLCFTTCDMSESGYTLVGRATVTVELDDDKDIVSRQVTVLRQKIDEVQKQAQSQVDAIEDQIRNLQALTYEPA